MNRKGKPLEDNLNGKKLKLFRFDCWTLGDGDRFSLAVVNNPAHEPRHFVA